jgi:hypothetical protein
MTKTYVGDTGTAIVLDTGQSLAGASSVSILARKPDGATDVTWTGTVVETTKVQFSTLAGTLDMAGEWRLQARVVLPSGTWLGETVGLTVYRPFA